MLLELRSVSALFDHLELSGLYTGVRERRCAYGKALLQCFFKRKDVPPGAMIREGDGQIRGHARWTLLSESRDRLLDRDRDVVISSKSSLW
jgi:hypothetical protein